MTAMPFTAPFIMSSTLTFQKAMRSLRDKVFSGTLERSRDVVGRDRIWFGIAT